MKKIIPILTAALLLPGALFAKEKKAVFAAGCFWCMEEIYEQLPGVTDVVSGYTGGDEKNPTYEQVSAGKTGHAEAIQITYDDEKTDLKTLLGYFWSSHDATNTRGVAPDFGKHYRSELYYTDAAEQWTMEQSKIEHEKQLGKKVATKIVPIKKFWKAEEYHQDYAKKNPNDPYIRHVSMPRANKALGK
ncbi:peptide-methionine (S)-S-oxide reductase MsrA [Verrucomicrobiaceae bacterium 5K15]|uniref:Peptide methionine sulfoxide reductase MsrA n=1 Tax=Oceaniferula flava TaxID=2800421 RepID=A0AAE2SGR4_9BACT|nr:peptide-methionine (S)-S-oxide reductase MsrA [Oceaniferula flavus]MBK1856270.1 peptide-methionine (S)-S-oxide reductase MsrA [Oceaniferula flavus]MBM1137577.1 peptide-methionine (S)-S-oxide reductase MsrA [Oceaniferula flavus]